MMYSKRLFLWLQQTRKVRWKVRWKYWI